MKNFISHNKYLIWLIILVIITIWGFGWVVMKASLAFMGPFMFSALRFGTGSLALIVIVFLLKIERPPRSMWKHFIIVGVLQTSVVYLFIMYGLRFVDAGKSSVLLYSMPLWSSFFAVKILGEKITPAKVMGLVMGMLGLVTILGWDVFIVQDNAVIFGELLIIFAAISWGISNVYYRVKLQDVSQLQVTAYQMLFGTVGIGIAALVTEWGDPIQLNATSIFYILFTGVLGSALCFLVWFLLLSTIDMVTATLPTLLVPVFGLFLSWWLLDENLTVSTVSGSVLILAGIAVAQFSKIEAKERVAEESR